jgi:hypothetical protein
MNTTTKPVIFHFDGKAYEVMFDDDGRGYLRDGNDWLHVVKYLKAHISERDHADFLNHLMYIKKEFVL